MAGKVKKTQLLCNRISRGCNFSLQDYANFLHNQRLSETAASVFLEAG